jgi:hypothetical protein
VPTPSTSIVALFFQFQVARQREDLRPIVDVGGVDQVGALQRRERRIDIALTSPGLNAVASLSARP